MSTKGRSKSRASRAKSNGNDKVNELEADREDGTDQFLTTNFGTRINDDQNTLKAGERGPSLLEDFHFREKITHFDHERIPERVVHARGSGAHGYFQVYESLDQYTKAGFLTDPSRKTPVFVRFSTVAGSRGSTDLARDVRGFATRFYTDEGNFDLVGNNIPVFFIQDSIKFPDVIHAVKPEPHNEMPQAASAHDTFWDFISLFPESMHMVMWVMSDRAIPRSYRMMEGFGVHTFRLVDERGKASFVKFHWKPLLGVHSVLWDEAQKISGKDPDFHRRDLWDSIEGGDYPEWELGLQIVEEKDEHKFDFDLLDSTKLIPEELVPVRRVGKLVLDRNPDNFFAETEQIAFHLGNIVPGIDFTDDPLLQGRLFSYLDTQLTRLGGPNFHEIPINRPVAPVHNNQRGGFMRQSINKGRVSYEPNSLGGNCPFQAAMAQGGFASYPEPVQGRKFRGKTEKFFDHFSQATLFWNSQSDAEKNHLVNALRFELGKVEVPAIRERMVYLLAHVDKTLAGRVAGYLGIEVPTKLEGPLNHAVPADADAKKYQPKRSKATPLDKSPALSMENTPRDSVATRKVAILAADGVDEAAVKAMARALDAAGATAHIVAPHLGAITGNKGNKLPVQFSFLTSASVLFDAVYVPGAERSATLLSGNADALHFVNEAYRHCKTIAATGAGVDLLRASYVGLSNAVDGEISDPGVVTGKDAGVRTVAADFVESMMLHRHWEREMASPVPA